MNEYQASIPETSNVRGFPGLVQLYNAADLFVLPSQVEGFGLPIAEAMACGVPVLVTKYAAGWEVAQPGGRGIPVKDWEVHKSSTLYANINPEDLAAEILRLKRNPNERKRMSEAGLKRVKDFTWDDFESKLIPALEAAYDGHQKWSAENQRTDSSNTQEGQEKVATTEAETQVHPEASEHIPEGQGEDFIHEETQDRPVEQEEKNQETS